MAREGSLQYYMDEARKKKTATSVSQPTFPGSSLTSPGFEENDAAGGATPTPLEMLMQQTAGPNTAVNSNQSGASIGDGYGQADIYGGSGGPNGVSLAGGYGSQLLTARGNLHDTLQDINQTGVADTRAMNQQYDSASGSALADLEVRGFGSSSLGANTIAGLLGQQQQGLQGIQNKKLGSALDAKQSGFDQITGSQESAIGYGVDQQKEQQSMLLSLLSQIS